MSDRKDGGNANRRLEGETYVVSVYGLTGPKLVHSCSTPRSILDMS